MAHPRRILSPRCRTEGRWHSVSPAEALDRIVSRSRGEVTILLDGKLPCEEIAAVAAWCKAWGGSKLCLVIEPADEMLLLGTEASGADYLSASALAESDAFLVSGGVLGANTACARALLDRRKAEPATPLVVIDPGAGVAVKFATHWVDGPAGSEMTNLLTVGAAAGVDVRALGWRSVPQTAAATTAGKALAGRKRLAVLIAAEYGRTSQWREIGFLAGTLAKTLGGGVAVQTTGANALAAVRMASALGTVPLAQALSDGPAMRVAVGCDVLGMLGWAEEGTVEAAAAALPNRTTELAEVVLPLALVAEMKGTCLVDGSQRIQTSPLLSPPAGVLTPAAWVEQLARRAGVSGPGPSPQPDSLARAPVKSEFSPSAVEDPPTRALLLGRQPSHAGSGALTGYGAWQAAACGEPDVQLSIEEARRMGLKDHQPVLVQAGGRSVRARVRLASELTGGTAVLSEGFAQTRALMPARIDGSGQLLSGSPAEFTIHPEASASK
ncbi:MAG: hypothetical protein MUP47_09460 [Phycisphaerae bacterium]|nr:hypothetical protein [Phycisphaerae bacterium]